MPFSHYQGTRMTRVGRIDTDIILDSIRENPVNLCYPGPRGVPAFLVMEYIEGETLRAYVYCRSGSLGLIW